jgi:putative nucleotidyltransferase with HDIG domain
MLKKAQMELEKTRISPTEELATGFVALKTLPQVALAIIRQMSNKSSALKDFEAIIRLDPALTCRVMQLINSPLFELKEQIDSLQRALALLGMKNLRNLILNDTLRNMEKTKEPGANCFSRKKLWIHSASVGICAQLIAKKIYCINGESALLAGLLHDIGLIIEAQVCGDRMMQTLMDSQNDYSTFLEGEENLLNTNHCLVGGYAAQQWNLPPHITEVIRSHHNQLDDNAMLEGISGIVQVAHFLVEQIGYVEIPGGKAQRQTTIIDHISLLQEHYRIMMKDFYHELKHIQKIYEAF